jgi:hypothetical protein
MVYLGIRRESEDGRRSSNHFYSFLMRKVLVILLLLISNLSAYAQTPVGSWADHLVYNTARSIAVGSSEVFASTGSSLMVYNKEYAELKKITRIGGLTETGISTIAWSEENKTLIIAYASSNIDLLKDNIIYNIPDISRKYIAGKKEINRVRTNGRYAYLACSFGIVVVDIIKREISDTWKPGNGSETLEIWDLAFGNGKIFAATGKGIFSADLSNPGLAYFGNWTLLNYVPVPDGKYTSVVFSGNKLYANLSVPYSGGDSVYSLSDISTLFSFQSGIYNTSFDPAPNGFTISAPSSVKYYNTDGSINKTISSYGSGFAAPYISQAVSDNTDIWISDIKSGLIRNENYSSFSSFSLLTLPGPVSNNAYSITSLNGKTIICGGGGDVSWNNLGRPFQVSIFENNIWTTRTSGSIIDPMRALIDPDNSNHFFVSTWGNGLLEYINDDPPRQYAYGDTLPSIIPGRPYVRICGLAMDKKKNLWITQSQVTKKIKLLKPGGGWIENPAPIDVLTMGDIIVTQTGQKWIVLPRGNGLFVLDDNGTPKDPADDRTKQMLVETAENEVISYVYSIAEDLDGNIWVGTAQGVFVYYTPEKIFDGNLKANRPKIPRNDGSGLVDYMLKSETVTSIAIDGANKKWIGTLNSGVYYLSSDGTALLKNFNEQNSPLLSNSIVSLAVDNKTGDVWFGTSKGIQSFRGEASAGNEKFANVYAFPNPVREDFTGNVTITGLMFDSQIRITDISGNLVFKTVSNGGQATWDLKTYNGKRVTTGVYLVFCASNDGTKSCVTKMLIIGK